VSPTTGADPGPTSAPTVQSLLQAAMGRIDPFEAELLLAHGLGRSRTWLYAHRDDRLPVAEAARCEALFARRAEGEPVAYLTGRRGFWAFDLRVTPQTLIPRPETERLVELALERAPPDRDLRIADLGTGSGAIALALAHERRRARVVATDISAGALEVARANARMLGLDDLDFRQGDWLAPLAGERFDLIVSNPPYIAEGDPHLRRGDLRHEPARALASGLRGLDAIAIIARDAPAHLHAGGWLLIEHGWEQGAAVRALLADAGFGDLSTERDLEGRDRVTIGRR
jgi:release factor glutamine methyltransferase